MFIMTGILIWWRRPSSTHVGSLVAIAITASVVSKNQNYGISRAKYIDIGVSNDEAQQLQAAGAVIIINLGFFILCIIETIKSCKQKPAVKMMPVPDESPGPNTPNNNDYMSSRLEGGPLSRESQMMSSTMGGILGRTSQWRDE